MPENFWRVTLLQSHGNDEDLTGRHKTGFSKCKFQFLVTITSLLIESTREADDNRVTFEERVMNLVPPCLSGMEPFCVEPDVESVPN